MNIFEYLFTVLKLHEIGEKIFNFLLNIFIDAEHFMLRGILFQISTILLFVEYLP